MPAIRKKVHSELPSGDPALLNRIAWARRWVERDSSLEYATEAQLKAKAGSGKRSRAEQGLALRTLAWHALWTGHMDTAMQHCLKAEGYLPESQHRDARAGIYALLAVVHYTRGRLDLATCAVDRGLWLLKDMTDGEAAPAQTSLLLARATVQRLGGERARAGITLSRARELAPEEHMPLVEYCTARWLLSDGDMVKAADHAARSVDLASRDGNGVMLSYAHAVQASVHTAEGHPYEARLSFAQARKLGKAAGDLFIDCIVHTGLASVARSEKNTDEAQTLLREAARIAKRENYAVLRKGIALDMAECFETAGDYKAALEQHKLAWRLQDDMRMR
ncbi:hypothetical protein EF888_00980 [Silicimonas algicola]|nr:hypothetical protein [Silicimonas algicola]AZQ65830.1 hypothetical protein EF888_00980 [Silicimonas algicola]